MPTLRPRRHRTPRSAFALHTHTHPSQLSPRTPSDHVLRDLAILSITAAFALTFLNLFLYAAILIVGLLAPAWQTFKALERPHETLPPLQHRTHHIPSFKPDDSDELELEHEHEVEDHDSDDDDLDWLPPSLLPPPRRRRAPVIPTPINPLPPSTSPAPLHNWQAYWVMAALLFALDGLLSPLITNLLPRSVYSAGIFSAVTWLTRNHGGNAAALYTVAVRPVFLRSEETVDLLVGRMLAVLEVACREAVGRVGGVMEPAVRSLQRAAEMGRAEVGAAVERRSRGGRFLR